MDYSELNKVKCLNYIDKLPSPYTNYVYLSDGIFLGTPMLTLHEYNVKSRKSKLLKLKNQT
jgi:hypothetical protein